MVTPEEIAQVPLFAQLDAAQREQLSRVAADIIARRLRADRVIRG